MKITVDCTTREVREEPLTEADRTQQGLDAEQDQRLTQARAEKEAAAAQRRADLDAIIAQYRAKTVTEPVTGGKPA